MATNKNFASISISEDGKVTRTSFSASKKIQQVYDAKSMSKLPDAIISAHQAIETGILPNTLLSYRCAMGSEQYVIAMPPGKYQIQIGKYEGDPKAEVFYVAMPWRVMIGDFCNGKFVGGRLFYAVDSPYEGEHIPLYHANVPNLNCYGYGDTSLGWICLYHTKDTSKFTMAQKATYVGMRVGSGEAFNTGNMPGTDGFKMYRENRPKSNLHIPQEWEKRSDKEGFEWILDSDLLMPIMVTSELEQKKHDFGPKAVPLTLGMAMRGRYKAYYSDPLPDKPFNKTGTQPTQSLFSTINNVVSKTAAVETNQESLTVDTTDNTVSTPAKPAKRVTKAAKKTAK